MAAASMSCVQLGLALSVHLFDQLGPLGVAGLRLAWAGVLLLVLVRPRLRHFTRRDLLACGVLGAVTAGLMLLFMLSLARIPLGTASALEFLGPLAVSLCGPGGGRRRWAVPAAIGVVLLTQPWHGGTDPAGLAFALAAAACWAAYILLTQHVGDHVTGLSGLAVSMPVAGVDRRARRRAQPEPGDLAAACHHAGPGSASSGGAVQPGIPRAAAPHRQCLRHPDEPGTGHRAAGRTARAQAGPGRCRPPPGSSSWSSLASAPPAPAAVRPSPATNARMRSGRRGPGRSPAPRLATCLRRHCTISGTRVASSGTTAPWAAHP